MGRSIALYSGNDWKPDTLLADLRSLLSRGAALTLRSERTKLRLAEVERENAVRRDPCWRPCSRFPTAAVYLSAHLSARLICSSLNLSDLSENLVFAVSAGVIAERKIREYWWRSPGWTGTIAAQR